MRTSGEKVRMLVEAERVQSVSCPHMISLSGLHIILLSVMPTEETGETYAYKLKNQFQLEEEGIRNIFCGI